ncbi:MAG: MarR family transcriptional regulator [Methanobrevibacter sp.]|jgi:DNA-binding MarR family transcriptional regulator|nr:MarR family transcriptional regulator [Candidatus Methanovirga basalitermitum]
MTEYEEKLSEKLYIQITQLGHFFHRFYHKNRISKFFKKEDVGQSQVFLLKILLKKDGITNSEIVELMDIRPSSAGELIIKLKKKGYVRDEIDPNDKRSSLIFLTEEGKAAAKIFNNQLGMFDSFFQSITKEEQEQLSLILEKLINSINDKIPHSHHKPHSHHNKHDEFGFMHRGNRNDPREFKHHGDFECHDFRP